MLKSQFRFNFQADILDLEDIGIEIEQKCPIEAVTVTLYYTRPPQI